MVYIDNPDGLIVGKPIAGDSGSGHWFGIIEKRDGKFAFCVWPSLESFTMSEEGLRSIADKLAELNRNKE